MQEKTQKDNNAPGGLDKMLKWDRILSDATARKKTFTEIMDTGRMFLSYPYAFADTSMEYLYATKEYLKELKDLPGIGKTDDGPAETGGTAMQEMFLDKKFHEAAKETSLFYYSRNDEERVDLCCNIFNNEQYYARMLLSLPPGQRTVSAEEEALFLFFSRRIENMISSIQGFLQKQRSDSIHSYLQALASGQDVPSTLFEKAAASAGLRKSDTFCVIYISFFSDEGWEAQYETTLPYLSRTLEVKWKYSCVVPVNKNLVWLVDLNRSEANVKSHSFYQELAFFLREHICSAGVSSRFGGFDSILYAVKQAEAALEIGRKMQPSFWYYLFDDYRLYYMLQKAGEDIPFRYLLPAAVLNLQEYDREKNAELCRTLKVYLRNNQNDSRTAEELHIHRTTLYRRLERIGQLTDLRLDNPDTVLELLILLRMAGEQ